MPPRRSISCAATRPAWPRRYPITACRRPCRYSPPAGCSSKSPTRGETTMSVKDQMARAEAAMTMLDAKWFSASTPNDWGGGGNFWKTPTICMAILSYMAQSGSQAYIQTIENARLVGQGYIGNCGYYD